MRALVPALLPALLMAAACGRSTDVYMPGPPPRGHLPSTEAVSPPPIGDVDSLPAPAMDMTTSQQPDMACPAIAPGCEVARSCEDCAPGEYRACGRCNGNPWKCDACGMAACVPDSPIN